MESLKWLIVTSAVLLFCSCNRNVAVDPPEAFGLSGVIDYCVAKEPNYTIACKAIQKSGLIPQIDSPGQGNYTLLIPSSSAMQIYFTANGLTEATFLSSSMVSDFIKKHILLGVLSNGASISTLGATQVTVAQTALGFAVNSAANATDFPVAKRVRTNIWLYALDKTLVQ